ncbi:MAG TPA: Zn-ribbon domain-containing OB-fold protein [Polyangiales bacterium]|nr:Zn-ribbon domain-containing OB-fold protein [Polyangiales bacterium]
MSEAREVKAPLPVAPFLKLPAAGEPYLEGSVCPRCDTTHLGLRLACAKCGARDEMPTRALSNRGTLHTFTIVHRSFPGVAVPYVSAVVDLEGGGTIKGNLINVEPDPKHISFGMRVEVVFGDALGRKDAQGNSYISYFFQPAGSSR